MAMGKAMTDPARGIAGSTIVTAMCRNGTDFGIRVSGTGDRWFTAPVEMPQGLYFPGFTAADANPDMGDSRDRRDDRARRLCHGGRAGRRRVRRRGACIPRRPSSRAPWREIARRRAIRSGPFPRSTTRGVPTGIDVRRVVETGIAPTINTGIAHRKPGVGQVGAGVVKAPLACFERGAGGARRIRSRVA